MSVSLSHNHPLGEGQILVHYQGSVMKKQMTDAEKDREFTTDVYWQVHFTDKQTKAQGITAYLGVQLTNSGAGI